MVKSISVETEYLPSVKVVDPFGPDPSVVGPFVRALRPRFTIEVGLPSPLVSAPFGHPQPKWPVIRTAGIVGGAILGTLALLGIRSLIRD